jgi:hypothetical protein
MSCPIRETEAERRCIEEAKRRKRARASGTGLATAHARSIFVAPDRAPLPDVA